MNDGEKTEDPTPKRLAESHAKGQFAKSQEMATAMIIAAAFGLLVFSGKSKAVEIGHYTISIFSNLHNLELNTESAATTFRNAIGTISSILIPLFLGVTVASGMAGGLQSGFKPTPKALQAKLDKLSPIKGFQRLFNKRNFIQLLVDLVKFSAMLTILYGLIREVMNDPIFSSPVPIQYLGEFLFRLFLQMISRLLVALMVIAAVDYLWQRFKTREELKMSKQEVKDEMKQAEGDPMIKAQRRRIAIKMLQQRMTRAVPGADVIVTNPTHFAVALKYEQGVDKAPIILAKGEGRLALKIKEIGHQHGVPMVENKPVARLLYKAGKVNESIPIELYQVVAQILAHVYRNHRYYFHRLKIRRMAERQAAASGGAELVAAS